MTRFLITGDNDAPITMLLAHGAGAPMDSPFMEAFAELLPKQNIQVVRFEFDYMADRRVTGSKRPPPRAEKLIGEFDRAIAELDADGALFIGGKSLGGRVASMMAQAEFDAGRISGLLCLGYPFHPPGRPERLRTAHLQDLTVPTLIVQGMRDPFGNAAEVSHYRLPAAISFHWTEDGDHDLKPRKASGHTAAGNWASAAERISAWAGDAARKMTG